MWPWRTWIVYLVHGAPFRGPPSAIAKHTQADPEHNETSEIPYKSLPPPTITITILHTRTHTRKNYYVMYVYLSRFRAAAR